MVTSSRLVLKHGNSPFFQVQIKLTVDVETKLANVNQSIKVMNRYPFHNEDDCHVYDVVLDNSHSTRLPDQMEIDLLADTAEKVFIPSDRDKFNHGSNESSLKDDCRSGSKEKLNYSPCIGLIMGVGPLPVPLVVLQPFAFILGGVLPWDLWLSYWLWLKNMGFVGPIRFVVRNWIMNLVRIGTWLKKKIWPFAGFDLSVDPESLMPIDKIFSALVDMRIETQIEMSVKVMKNKLIHIELYDKSLGRWLAELCLSVNDSIFFRSKDYDPANMEFPFLDKLMTKKTYFIDSKNIDGSKERKYKNLRPWVTLKTFILESSLQEQGIGRKWYEKIERYCVDCGFNVIAAETTCGQETKFSKWYDHRGFSSPFEMYAIDLTVFYLRMKFLNNEADYSVPDSHFVNSGGRRSLHCAMPLLGAGAAGGALFAQVGFALGCTMPLDFWPVWWRWLKNTWFVAVHCSLLKFIAAIDRVAYRLKAWLGVDRKIDVEMAKFVNRHTLADIKDFDSEKPAFLINIYKNALAQLKRFFNLTRLESYIQCIRFFIKSNIHKLSLLKLKPIGGNYSRFTVYSFINYLKRFIAKLPLSNLPPLKAGQYLFRVAQGIFNVFLRELSFVNSKACVFSVNGLHIQECNTSFGLNQAQIEMIKVEVINSWCEKLREFGRVMGRLAPALLLLPLWPILGAAGAMGAEGRSQNPPAGSPIDVKTKKILRKHAPEFRWINTYYENLQKLSCFDNTRVDPSSNGGGMWGYPGIFALNNEPIDKFPIQGLEKRGGIILTTSVDLYNSLACIIEADGVINIDNNRCVNEIIIPALGLIISRYRTREEILAVLLGREITQDEKKLLEEKTAVEVVVYLLGKPCSYQLQMGVADWIYSEIEPYVPDDLVDGYGLLFGPGKKQKIKSTVSEYLKLFDVHSKLLKRLAQEGPNGFKPWFATQESVDYLRKLYQGKKIVGVSGDITNKEVLEKVNSCIGTNKKVSLAYISNIPDWIARLEKLPLLSVLEKMKVLLRILSLEDASVLWVTMSDDRSHVYLEDLNTLSTGKGSSSISKEVPESVSASPCVLPFAGIEVFPLLGNIIPQLSFVLGNALPLDLWPVIISQFSRIIAAALKSWRSDFKKLSAFLPVFPGAIFTGSETNAGGLLSLGLWGWIRIAAVLVIISAAIILGRHQMAATAERRLASLNDSSDLFWRVITLSYALKRGSRETKKSAIIMAQDKLRADTAVVLFEERIFREKDKEVKVKIIEALVDIGSQQALELLGQIYKEVAEIEVKKYILEAWFNKLKQQRDNQQPIDEMIINEIYRLARGSDPMDPMVQEYAAEKLEELGLGKRADTDPHRAKPGFPSGSPYALPFAGVESFPMLCNLIPQLSFALGNALPLDLWPVIISQLFGKVGVINSRRYRLNGTYGAWFGNWCEKLREFGRAMKRLAPMLLLLPLWPILGAAGARGKKERVTNQVEREVIIRNKRGIHMNPS
ncbi:MAG: hypothetical protein NTX01_06665, partial [Candidatus Omnitrophica bacterium]|nr:hypothetical protein [Candidatus Omnitrophota bacterium]